MAYITELEGAILKFIQETQKIPNSKKIDLRKKSDQGFAFSDFRL